MFHYHIRPCIGILPALSMIHAHERYIYLYKYFYYKCIVIFFLSYKNLQNWNWAMYLVHSLKIVIFISKLQLMIILLLVWRLGYKCSWIRYLTTNTCKLDKYKNSLFDVIGFKILFIFSSIWFWDLRSLEILIHANHKDICTYC